MTWTSFHFLHRQFRRSRISFLGDLTLAFVKTNGNIDTSESSDNFIDTVLFLSNATLYNDLLTSTCLQHGIDTHSNYSYCDILIIYNSMIWRWNSTKVLGNLCPCICKWACEHIAHVALEDRSLKISLNFRLI